MEPSLSHPAPSPPLAACIKGQFCKYHPKVKSKQDKNGVHMGLCQECLAERAARNSRSRGAKAVKEKMTQAVARDLAKKSEPAHLVVTPPFVMKELGAEVVARGREAVRRLSESFRPQEKRPDIPNNPPMCLTHNLPIKFNRKGISMGGCEECRRDIAAMGGHKAKIQLALNPLERVFADHPEELAWLIKYAKIYVRSPEGELIYLCKRAMEAAG